MTLHREPGPADRLRPPSRHALLLTTWLVACALGVSAAIDGVRAFEPATAPAASPPADELPDGDGGSVPALDPALDAGPGTGRDHLSAEEQERLDAWEQYVAALADGDPGEPPREVVPAGGGAVPASLPPSAAQLGVDGPAGGHGPGGTPGEGKDETRAGPPEGRSPAPEAPVEPGGEPEPTLLGGVLSPVSDLLAGVLGLLGGAPSRP